MRPINNGNPLTVAAGADTSVTDFQRNDRWLVLYNESPLAVLVTTTIGTQQLPAWTGDKFDLTGNGGTPFLKLTGVNVLTQSAPPASSVIGTFYTDAEEPKGQYPVALARQVSVGQPVSTNTSPGIKNDGNGPATQIIEATPSDQASSSWAFSNDASGNLSILSAGALRDIIRAVRGNATTGKAAVVLGDSADPSILTMFGKLGSINSDGGAIQSDGAGHFTTPLQTSMPGAVGNVAHADFAQTVANGATAGRYQVIILHSGQFDLFDVTNNGSLMSGNLSAFSIFPPLTATLAKITSDGGQITSDAAGNLTINGTTGLILRNSSGSGMHGAHQSSGVGNGTFTHGLTTTPNTIQITTHAGTSTQTSGYGSENATTFVVTTFSGLGWVALATVHT